MEELEFFKDSGLDEELLDRIKESFIEITKTGFKDEYETLIEVEWYPESGLCKISYSVLDSWDEEDLLPLLQELFLSAVQEIADELEDEDRDSEGLLLKETYGLTL